MQKRYKIVLFRGDWIFAIFTEKTRKEAEKKERAYREEMRTWCDSEPKPTSSQRGWVVV